MEVHISPMIPNDAAAVAALAAQLGYPTTAEAVRAHLKLMGDEPHQDILVARAGADGAVIAWVHVYRTISIAYGPTCSLGGFVVDEACRNQGVGRKLLAAAEHWARAHSSRSMQFKSRQTRTDAHRFYERAGYTMVKVSHVFSKKL